MISIFMDLYALANKLRCCLRYLKLLHYQYSYMHYSTIEFFLMDNWNFFLLNDIKAYKPLHCKIYILRSDASLSVVPFSAADFDCSCISHLKSLFISFAILFTKFDLSTKQNSEAIILLFAKASSVAKLYICCSRLAWQVIGLSCVSADWCWENVQVI